MKSKHKALQEWVQTFLDTNYLYFESADAYPHVRTIVPNYGDYVDKVDILGFNYKPYSFVFLGYEKIDPGPSDVNKTNMELRIPFTEG